MFKREAVRQGALDMLGCGQETSSGLKLYLTDNSWKNGGKRT